MGFAEGDRAALAQDASFGEQDVAAGRGDEGHVEIERGLVDTAGGGGAIGAERAAHRRVDQRGQHAAVHRGAGSVAELVAHRHP